LDKVSASFDLCPRVSSGSQSRALYSD